MKTIITLIFVGLSFLSSYGQDLKLSILKDTEEPNTAKEHSYLIGVSNISNSAVSFLISSNNTLCVNEKSPQIDFSHEILNKRKERQAKQLTLKSGESIELILKLIRPINSKLNSWNCTQIMATSNKNNALSNAITIESFIPDPKDFN